ncbi:hypothetical protein CORC01_00780 [Colletotrichum orchidophilum]|uniref:Uncharacterized protein n=1 Tax=Colletotrichum orchidophilum TaxID=1209926 RepID=A0A1G4BRC4_9PEZI|nr:uncharacterized protein CORC01_00780 [Colletotrichum orchidophilum]OHF03918.1 hypothetical protein CORC01_00780 [Colletotrichum orchidophilum]
MAKKPLAVHMVWLSIRIGCVSPGMNMHIFGARMGLPAVDEPVRAHRHAPYDHRHAAVTPFAMEKPRGCLDPVETQPPPVISPVTSSPRPPRDLRQDESTARPGVRRWLPKFLFWIVVWLQVVTREAILDATLIHAHAQQQAS